MSEPAQQQMISSHGNSKYIQSTDQLFGKLQFQEFAPARCSCCACLIPDVQKGRMYAHVYDNRVSSNMPLAPFCCLTSDEKCIIDFPITLYHDRSPSRSGMCCFVIPCTCCGPPVIFLQKPKFAGVDVTEYLGEQVMGAPCNIFGLKKCLCCGGPCYMGLGVPLFRGVKDGVQFLEAWKASLEQYGQKNGINTEERAIFEIVKDSEFDHNKAQKIGMASAKE